MPKFGEVKKKKAPEPEAGDRRKKKDEDGKAGDKPAESVKVQQAAHQAAKALMGGHPQMVRWRPEKNLKANRTMVGTSPGWKGCLEMRIQIGEMTEPVNLVVELEVL